MEIWNSVIQRTYPPPDELDFLLLSFSVANLALELLASKFFQTPHLLTSSLILISGAESLTGIFITLPLAKGNSNPESVYLMLALRP